MVLHNSMSDTYTGLARKCQKHLSYTTCEHGLIDHGKDRKRSSKHNWTDRDYHAQDCKDIQHKYLKISYVST